LLGEFTMCGVTWLGSKGFCPCCDSTSVYRAFRSPDRFFQRGKEYQFSGCAECGCLFLVPDGGDWSTDEAYPSEYPAHTTRQRIRWFHRLIPGFFFPRCPRSVLGEVVEVGAGTGLYLEYLSRRFHHVHGIEPDTAAVQQAQAMGRPVQRGGWETFEPGDGTVGAVIMNQVIEHLTQPPAEVVKKAHRLLRSGGFWCIRTPNADSWGRKHFAECWHPLEVPRHTIIYSAGGLARLAENNGFAVLRLRFTGRAYDITQSTLYERRAGKRGVLAGVLGSFFPLSFGARLIAMAMNSIGRGDSFELLLQKK
jgi:SAM-dependent methyltransferase